MWATVHADGGDVRPAPSTPVSPPSPRLRPGPARFAACFRQEVNGARSCGLITALSKRSASSPAGPLQKRRRFHQLSGSFPDPLPRSAAVGRGRVNGGASPAPAPEAARTTVRPRRSASSCCWPSRTGPAVRRRRGRPPSWRPTGEHWTLRLEYGTTDADAHAAARLCGNEQCSLSLCRPTLASVAGRLAYEPRRHS